jgi:hypothetical protein
VSLRRPTASVATGFAYDAQVRMAQAKVLARLIPRVRDIRRFASAALDLAWTAAGRHDAYFERTVKPWDIAAGELICRCAGLRVLELPAHETLPWGILVARQVLAERLLELLSDPRWWSCLRSNYHWVMQDVPRDLPGHQLVSEGLEDLAAGRESEASLLVAMGAPRLRALGFDVPEATGGDPSHRLFALLERGEGAHSRYNALIGQLVSFARAAESAHSGR